MAEIDVSMTLAELVEAHPGLAREFEGRNLDYCCGGQQTFNDACAQLGLHPHEVAAELAAVAASSQPTEWSSMATDALVDHIEAAHHRYLWDEMPRVTALIDKITSVHGARHPELAEIGACFAEMRADLEPHMHKEERVLFPMIRELATASALPAFHCGTLRNPIGVMLSEHEAVGGLLTRLRALTNDYTPPADGCATYSACFIALADLEADTHLHIHKENNVLFPAVLQLENETLSPSDSSPHSCPIDAPIKPVRLGEL